MSKVDSVAAFVIVVVIVTAAAGAVTLNGGLPPAYTGSTTTTTLTMSCPTVNSTQTGGNGTPRLPGIGPLLGNVSAITTVENVYSTGGNFVIVSNLLVLNRSFTSSGAAYLVNVTMEEVSSNVTTVNVNGLLTYTSTTVGNQEQVGSVLGLVVSNGSMVSVEKSSGASVVTNELTVYPLGSFEPFASINSTASNLALHRLNSTVVEIGSTRMIVTNYELPTLVMVQLQEGCSPGTPGVSSVATISNGTIQAGRVPGTDFTLITEISESFAFQSNSTSFSGISSASVTEKVTSLSVG